jgi:hypothetical protein
MSNLRPSARTTAYATYVAALLVAPALVACSSGGTDEPSADKPSKAPASAAEAVPVSSTLEGRTPALKHLKIEACPSGDGKVVAKGTVRNRGDEVADYVVTVTWLDEGGKALETVESEVKGVKPATNAPWKATAELDEPAGSCTTTLARGTLP